MALPQMDPQKRQGVSSVKQRSYQEIAAYLDAHWDRESNTEAALARMVRLDKELGSVAKQLPAIFVAGTNGKSLTIHFTAKLLQTEGAVVGTFYSPHILTYNERFAVNHETMPNKVFTDLGNMVIDAAERLGLDMHSQELLTMMAILHFKESKVDVAILEARQGCMYDPVNVCHPRILGITRSTPDATTVSADEMRTFMYECTGAARSGTSVISGDQVKANLQLMEDLVTQRGGVWVMPIRKLAPLMYPFEQLHGRCAALAERIAHIFINGHLPAESEVTTTSILRKVKGKRGRPTIEAKRDAQRNPKKNVGQFWKETINSLPGRFQMLDKEKPSILLDNASNLDAFENTLLGVRLLHYQKPIKGLTMIIGAERNTLQGDDFLRAVRYFFKKTPGQVFICPIDCSSMPGNAEKASWDVEEIVSGLRTHKVKAQSFGSFELAFEAAKQTVDDRYGLVVITGSNTIISEYWQHKGLKKLA